MVKIKAKGMQRPNPFSNKSLQKTLRKERHRFSNTENKVSDLEIKKLADKKKAMKKKRKLAKKCVKKIGVRNE